MGKLSWRYHLLLYIYIFKAWVVSQSAPLVLLSHSTALKQKNKKRLVSSWQKPGLDLILFVRQKWSFAQMSCHLSYSEGRWKRGFDSFFQALREAGGMLLKLSRQSCNVDFFFFFYPPPFPSLLLHLMTAWFMTDVRLNIRLKMTREAIWY